MQNCTVRRHAKGAASDPRMTMKRFFIKQLMVAGPYCGEAPEHIGHPAADVVELDPITHPQRIIQLQRHPAQHIAQRILHGKGQHGSDDG